MKQSLELIHRPLSRFVATVIVATLTSLCSWAQVIEDVSTEPAPDMPPLNPIIKNGYEQLLNRNSALDLRVPSNIRTVVEFDPVTRNYTIVQKIGEWTVSEPLILTEEEYNRWQMSVAMDNYWRELGRDSVPTPEKRAMRNPFNPLDMNFSLGKLDRIFGPGGLRLRTRGSIQLKMGIRSNRTDNPAIALNSRSRTNFEFDQKIQATVSATVGELLKFDMTYNTDATFDFDSKNIKLAYNGKEDDIVQNIEAGNVSMTTGSSLIRGSNSLFGIKTKLQFGKLTTTALLSQQNAESRSVNTRGGVQTTEFSLPANEYDQNRHFFLAHWFQQNYDRFAANLPLVTSGVKISRIEVWVTNRNSDFEQSRNLVAFQDLGESNKMNSSHWIGNPAYPFPTNNSNNLLQTIKADYPDARNIALVTQTLAGLADFGVQGGIDYEKVESARLLNSNEYVLNSTLGYISLKSALSSDEVLAVAFEYTYNGQVYQVGEFSSDITSTDQSLYVKMLRATSISPRYPMWQLMMKNVYSIGAYQMQSTNFKMQVKFLSDTTGTQLMYIPEPGVSNTTLLQIMGLDRIDSNQLSNPDGFFDYIEGYTVISSMGKIIFPVVEPFGRHLESALSSVANRDKYVYKELYDSTYVTAAQFSDKNKYYLTGEYQASSGAQIRLNAVNVARGSVVVTAGSTVLTENVDYTVDYSMGIVTITNQSIIDSGQNISVTLENQSLYSTQRKTLLGLDLQYQFNRNLNFGATLLHYSEKALTEKVNIGDEVISNTMWGLNLSYNNKFMWLTNILNKIPTVNATAPSSISLNAEFAQLIPHSQSGAQGASYVDDFEESQVGIDLRSPYAWQLASTPYQDGNNPLFPEASLINNLDYGKNRALLAWNYIDRMFTDRNSSLCPGYIRSDLKQLSNPYVREVTSQEIFPGRELNYGESSLIQTLNLSFYPKERGPYNVDATNIDSEFNLLNPEKRWGGVMRRMDNTNFEQSNIEYLQFWLMSPFLDPENPLSEGGDLYINFGDISEDILKDGKKSYENGIPVDGNQTYITETVWGRVSTQSSLTYSFDNNNTARLAQDVGLDGLPNSDEFTYPSYEEYLQQLRNKLSASKIAELEKNEFSPFNDPAGDNYHFFRGYDYDEQKLSILERYKHYNGVEGNSLSADLIDEPLYQSSRNTPDVEDINQDNTLNEYERYFQYKISIRPEDFVVGRNYITDKQTSIVRTRDGENQEVEWYQFKIPLSEYDRAVGSISDFTTIRFMRMFLTNFYNTVHLRFGTLELVRGEWRPYQFNLNTRGETTTTKGELDVTVVNIEENASREPVNYVLPPGVTRLTDPSQSQITQLNEQSLSLTVRNLSPGDARAIYRNTQLDLRNYGKLQMWIHAEALIDNSTSLASGDLALVVRLGTDSRNNYYQYEIPLSLTPPGQYNNYLPSDREIVWPLSNYMDIDLQNLVSLKQQRNRDAMANGSNISYNVLYTGRDPDNEANVMGVMGNPALNDVRVMLIGIKNNASTTKSGNVWINELKVTDFNESGGWAIKGNMNLGLSDVATFNMSFHKETAGFGNVDQGLNDRRMDDFTQYAMAVQGDLGRFLPAKARLNAPIYYSYSNEKSTPKYNPLDQDVLLSDALDATSSKQQRDSIMNYALDRSQTSAFSISGFRFDIVSETPKPWDPGNFTFNFSFNKQSKVNPTTEYENTNDYRGSLLYNYTPNPKGFKPFAKIKGRNANLKFLKEWEIFYLPSNISFLNTISRYYYELQSRSALDDTFQLPVSVSKNFLWDRQINISWNLTKQLTVNLMSNTSARIEETAGAVNKKLFPDEYKAWKDTVWNSILHLGTPWAYNQTFDINYRAPFNRIPALDFITANASYNSMYSWDRGTTINDLSTGNSVSSQSTWNADGRINFEGFYNKIPYLKSVNQRFASNRRGTAQRKPRKMERNFTVAPDSAINIRHNLRSKRVRVVATTLDGKQLRVSHVVKDNNNISITLRKTNDIGDEQIPIKVTITEIMNNEKSLWRHIADYSTRMVMSVRSLSVRWRSSRSLMLPLFANEVGDWFGQSGKYGPLSPGLGFAFGFISENYVYQAKERGWLITDNGQTSPALWARTSEFNFELGLEPIKGLKIVLTSNHTDNHTDQIHFMYQNNPVVRGGSFVKTHWALASALRGSSASNGYYSEAFSKFLDYVPIIAQRVEKQYAGLHYPSTGFLEGSPYAGQQFNEAIGSLQSTSPDVLIPAFIAAYSGYSPESVYLTPFPSLGYALPNWRVTYDGLTNLWNLSNYFKAITLSHSYQCTYTVGSYSSYINWQSASGPNGTLGFIQNELTGTPVPSSPFNISSVAITERFAPLIGVSVTLKNNMTFNADWRDQRTLTLNTSAGQIVEASTSGLIIGAGYKIVGFNTFLKMKNTQKGISNDLTLNAEFSLQTTHALIRRIETAYTQATSGTRTLSVNFTANYVLSKRLTVGAYFDHHVNTPLVTNSSYPTSNTAFGILFNFSLAR